MPNETAAGLALLGSLSAALAACMFACVAIDCHELLDAWRTRAEPEPPIPVSDARPFVSIHVPVRAEPPAIVARTLHALAVLDYAAFEVLVISNNTPDPALHEPIARLCAALGPRFRFFDIPVLQGFKAGALNFALRHTSAAATIICTLDCDYAVLPGYLARFAPAFADPNISFVQCPQDYRDWQDDPFLRMCYWEYWQFFAIGMVLRSRGNAAMLHGTMALVRKAALADAGGWAEWCLTEDSECGLRLLAGGGIGLYTTQSWGEGLIPFDFGDYMRQRRRWVIGGSQQMRRYLGLLFRPPGLSATQRYLVIRSWAPWLRDACVVTALPVVAAAAAFAWLACPPHPATPLLSAGLAAVLANHVLRQWLICRVLLRLSWRDTAFAACAVIALTFTIGISWWRGIMRRPVAYVRTPKDAGAKPFLRFEARAESAIVIALALLALPLLAPKRRAAIADLLALVQCVALMLPACVLARASRLSAAARERRVFADERR